MDTYSYLPEAIGDTTMSYVKRNEYLARSMGFTYVAPSGLAQAPNNKGLTSIPDFSTWDGFGQLFTWSQEQWWWEEFTDFCEYNRKFHEKWSHQVLPTIINPDNFSDAVYNYLQGANK